MAIALKSAYVMIPVSSFERSIEWYGKYFGFKVVTEDPFYVELQNDSGVRVIFLQKKHDLSFHFAYPDGLLQSPYGFIVDDAEAVYQYLAENGVEVGPLFDYQGKSFSFYDPDGNFIEIWSLAEDR